MAGREAPRRKARCQQRQSAPSCTYPALSTAPTNSTSGPESSDPVDPRLLTPVRPCAIDEVEAEVPSGRPPFRCAITCRVN